MASSIAKSGTGCRATLPTNYPARKEAQTLADTTYPNLGLTGPDVGASSDTWGTKWNANAALLDRAFIMAAATNVAGGNQSLTNSSFTKIALGTELFDSAGYFSSSTFTPLVAGYYRLRARVPITGTAITRGIVSFYKNGAEADRAAEYNGSFATELVISAETIMQFNGSTDYADLYAFTTASSGNTIAGSGVRTALFYAQFLHT